MPVCTAIVSDYLHSQYVVQYVKQNTEICNFMI